MRVVVKWCSLLVVFIAFSVVCGAQEIIKGTVRDSIGKVIPSVSVTLKSGDGTITAYTLTDEKGAYALRLPLPIPKEGLFIEASRLGFKRKRIALLQFSQAHDIVLANSAIVLPTVVIKDKGPRLKLNGDTLSYTASEFSRPQDRVIGDVIKRLPGITVAENGRIAYNGRPISNFYIDGDNMLDDKYNIATKSIPNLAVDKVQVIENDQPIKMLRNKTLNDDVALNVTLKKESRLKLIGQASAGAGAPEKFNEEINALLFRPQYKFINILKGNNTGNDPSNDLISHNLADILKQRESNDPAPQLSTGNAGNPNLPENRYLFNTSGLINLNNLLKFGKDTELKTNAYYLLDRRKQDYQKLTEIYLPNDTIRYKEFQNSTSRPDLLHIQAAFKVNRERQYLVNTLMLDYSPSVTNAGLLANEKMLGQQLKQRLTTFSNELGVMRTMKSGVIVGAYSYINHVALPEQLWIEPGVNNALFNWGKPYIGLRQDVNSSSWFIDNNVYLRRSNDVFGQAYKLGFSVQSQHMGSAIDLRLDKQGTNTQPDSSSNALHWLKNNVYAEAAYTLKKDKIEAYLTLPLSLKHISYNDPLYEMDKQMERLFINPELNIKYLSGIENFFRASYRYNNTIGTMDEVYRGNILKNYLTAYANDAPVSEIKTHTVALSFNFRKAIKIFFFNINTSYSRILLNNISWSILTNDVQRRVVLPYKNSRSMFTLNAGISKYAFALGTTFSGQLNFQTNQADQFQNNNLLPYQTVSKGGKVGAETKLNNYVSLSYELNFNQTSSHGEGSSSYTRFNVFKQQGEATIVPTPNLFVTVLAEHFITRQKGQANLEYFFADMSARYKFNKIRTDFSLGLNNIFDVKDYSVAYLTANTYSKSCYAIPGRMVLLKASFTF